MSGVSQKTREYWVAKARGWAERLSGPQDDEFNAVMDDIMLSASRAEAAEARLAERDAEVARLTELQRAASEFIGYIKDGNNAKAHPQMLFLEVLINEESKNGAKK